MALTTIGIFKAVRRFRVALFDDLISPNSFLKSCGFEQIVPGLDD